MFLHHSDISKPETFNFVKPLLQSKKRNNLGIENMPEEKSSKQAKIFNL